jgi:translation elongation factor EF-G
MKMLKFKPGANGAFEEQEIPQEAKGKADEWRQQLIELVAEGDENLLNKYLEQGGLSDEDLAQGIRTGVRARKVIPLLCASATQNVGVSSLLDFLTPSAVGEVSAPCRWWMAKRHQRLLSSRIRRDRHRSLSSRRCRSHMLVSSRSSGLCQVLWHPVLIS